MCSGCRRGNSIRVLDWITSLPDVDAEKIGVTGASGVERRHYILGAIDPRPKACSPR